MNYGKSDALLERGTLSDSTESGGEILLQLSVAWQAVMGSIVVRDNGRVIFEPLVGSRRSFAVCCAQPAKTYIIPGAELVGAHLSGTEGVEIFYTERHESDKKLRRSLHHLGPLHCSSPQDAQQLVASLQLCGRQGAPERRVMVFINPKSGQGRSAKMYRQDVLPIFEAAGFQVTAEETQYAGHAVELAQRLDLTTVDVIACAGGDGTVFEVVQGLMARSDWEAAIRTPLAQLPCGSGNALSANAGYFNTTAAAHAVVKCVTRPLDLVSILQPATSKRFTSFLSIMYGLLTNIDIGTEYLRWMGGARFIVGGVQHGVINQKLQPAHVAVFTGSEEQKDELDDLELSDSQEAGGKLLRERCGSDGGAPATPLLDSLGALDPQAPFEPEMLPKGWRYLGAEPYSGLMACNLVWLDNDMFRPAAKAGPGTGCLDVLYFHKLSRSDFLTMLLDSDKVAEQASCHYLQVKALIIYPLGTGTWLTADGEVLPFHPIFAEIHPSLASIIVAPP